MAIRYCGDVKVCLARVGVTGDGREEYRGMLVLPSGRRWRFKNLCSGVGGATASEMAASAVCFGGYYSSLNRGDDTPKWAPPADMADEIESSAETGDRGYIIRRRPGGKVILEG